jgi:hypothetical protein
MIRALLKASVLLAVSYSYCYSDTTYGVTNNAAGAGLAWSMYDVLPDATPPWITLEINGLTYRYTMNKDPNADAQVHVRNEDALNGGYVFEETDDWSQLPGGTIQKFYRFPYIDSTRWGDGEMVVEGDGTITDPLMVYNYKMDVNDQLMKCAATPLAEKQKEETLEKRMGGKNSVEAMVDTKQQESILAALAAVPKIEPYYTVTIQGGEYEETLKLEDKEIPDNRRALSNLASDAKHKTMVRSQYDREQ